MVVVLRDTTADQLRTTEEERMMRVAERGFSWVAVWLATGCATMPPTAGDAEPTPVGQSTAAAATIWEGVYTTEQARRGQQIALSICFECHSVSEWRGPGFLRLWTGRRVGDLYERICRTMPQNDPGRLLPGECADVIAYMFGLQGVPTGDGQRELPSDIEVLDTVFITPAENE